MMYDISLETNWWVLSNVSLIMEIYIVVPEIYVQIALTWGLPVQLDLWESVY